MISHPALESFKCAGGFFDVEPYEMDLNIGRRGYLVNPDIQLLGTWGLTGFIVVGVQNNYRGEKCYRVVHNGDIQQFGRVLPKNVEIAWE